MIILSLTTKLNEFQLNGPQILFYNCRKQNSKERTEKLPHWQHLVFPRIMHHLSANNVFTYQAENDYIQKNGYLFANIVIGMIYKSLVI